MPGGSRGVGGQGHGIFMNAWLRDDVLKRVQLLKPVAEALGITLSQLAIAWVLSRPSISGVVIGASREGQVRENAAASGVAIGEDVAAEVDEILGNVITDDPRLTTSPDPRP